LTTKSHTKTFLLKKLIVTYGNANLCVQDLSIHNLHISNFSAVHLSCNTVHHALFTIIPYIYFTGTQYWRKTEKYKYTNRTWQNSWSLSLSTNIMHPASQQVCFSS